MWSFSCPFLLQVTGWGCTCLKPLNNPLLKHTSPQKPSVESYPRLGLPLNFADLLEIEVEQVTHPGLTCQDCTPGDQMWLRRGQSDLTTAGPRPQLHWLWSGENRTCFTQCEDTVCDVGDEG